MELLCHCQRFLGFRWLLKATDMALNMKDRESFIYRNFTCPPVRNITLYIQIQGFSNSLAPYSLSFLLPSPLEQVLAPKIPRECPHFCPMSHGRLRSWKSLQNRQTASTSLRHRLIRQLCANILVFCWISISVEANNFCLCLDVIERQLTQLNIKPFFFTRQDYI